MCVYVYVSVCVCVVGGKKVGTTNFWKEKCGVESTKVYVAGAIRSNRSQLFTPVQTFQVVLFYGRR